ncbi:MAG: MlaD family protein [Calditrichia bacterium]
MNYQRMAFLSGVVVFAGIFILMTAILVLSEHGAIFSDEYPIEVKFANISGLQEQASVFLRGYKIGTIGNVGFEDDGVIVVLKIKNEYKIPKDSRFELTTVSMLGEKAVSIHPGGSPRYLAAGARVKGTSTDLMGDLQETLQSIKTSFESGLMAEQIQKISTSLDHLQSILAKTDRKVDQIDVEMYNRQIQEIGRAAAEVQSILKQNTGKVGETLHTLNDAGKELTRLSRNLAEIAGKIQQGEGTAGKLLTDEKYLENLNATIYELQLLLKELRENPKKYINVSVF